MSFKSPMLATLIKKRFSDPKWVFEKKLNTSFPEIVAAFATPPTWREVSSSLSA
ncbi:hypothetical protein [Simkania sp.]|uniref:hypothetical protein n=1 Tax=Simkania sp. TaxID=34094 RepID=UPI003B52D8B0